MDNFLKALQMTRELNDAWVSKGVEGIIEIWDDHMSDGNGESKVDSEDSEELA